MRAKVNLTLDPKVAADARTLGINMSRVAEQAIAEEVKRARNRDWVERNKDALEAYAREVEREGLPLARFRSF